VIAHAQSRFDIHHAHCRFLLNYQHFKAGDLSAHASSVRKANKINAKNNPKACAVDQWSLDTCAEQFIWANPDTNMYF